MLLFHYNSIGPRQLVYKHKNLCAYTCINGEKTSILESEKKVGCQHLGSKKELDGYNTIL